MKLGAPFKLSERDRRFILRKIKENPRFFALKLSGEERFGIKVCPKTVRRVISSEHAGTKAEWQAEISSLIRNRKILYLAFALSMESKDFSCWNNVIFANESKFNTFGSNEGIII